MTLIERAELIETALHIAMLTHRGQRDKGGAAYILHPIRVMGLCQTDDQRIVALLHDTVEDGASCVWEAITEAFPPEIAEAVDCLTRRKGEAYDAFIDRCASNELAAAVKMADLQDNSILSRITNPTQKDYDRQEKYLRAMANLKAREVEYLQENDNAR